MTPPMFDSTAARFEALTQQAEALNNDLQSFGQTLDLPADSGLTWIQVFDGYAAVLVVAFLVSLIATPIMRRLAMANGVVDRPDARKIHRMPIAYLGGVAVFLGIMGGVLVSFFGATGEDIVRFHDTSVSGMRAIFPPTILLGITVIMLIGLIDDVVGISPRLKVGGQLFAAAALAADSVGTSLAKGVLSPTLGAWLNHSDLTWHIPLPTEMPFLGSTLELDLIYWTGTAVIAIFVLGGCNASNLIDGLDGLCSGVTAVAMIGMLAIAIMMVDDPIRQDSLEGPRIVLILAVLGACLGFLPHNFNPANIFLGDCGSLMLGFTSIVVILTLGETGRTELVVAGLFIYGVPIVDTALAIIRRKMAGKRMSDPDSDHLHHMLKRELGVKKTALVLYAMGGGFAVLGVMIAATNARITYTIAILFASLIGVYAIKVARRKHIEEQMRLKDEQALTAAGGAPAIESPGGNGVAVASSGEATSAPSAAPDTAAGTP